MPRPHLIEGLDAGPYRKLTLISAPAGFGKTTPVSEWIQTMGRSTPPTAVAWLSLDDSDNDLSSFLAYLIAALQAALQTTAARQGTAGSIGKLMTGGPPGLKA